MNLHIIALLVAYVAATAFVGYCWPPFKGHTGDRVVGAVVMGGIAFVSVTAAGIIHYLIF